jgi:AraC family cel operon transcriptional repressor
MLDTSAGGFGRPGGWHHLAIILFLPGRPVRLHTHDFPEIFWIERGAAEHHINGRVKSLRAGDLVCVRPEDRHLIGAADPAGFTLVNLAYHPRVRADLLRRHRADFGPLLAASGELPFRAELAAAAVVALRRQLAELERPAASRLALEHFCWACPRSFDLRPAPSLPRCQIGCGGLATRCGGRRSLPAARPA